MNANVDSKILYANAICAFILAAMLIIVAMTVPETPALIPIAIAFNLIMAISVIVARVNVNLTKRIEKLEQALAMVDQENQ